MEIASFLLPTRATAGFQVFSFSEGQSMIFALYYFKLSQQAIFWNLSKTHSWWEWNRYSSNRLRCVLCLQTTKLCNYEQKYLPSRKSGTPSQQGWCANIHVMLMYMLMLMRIAWFPVFPELEAGVDWWMAKHSPIRGLGVAHPVGSSHSSSLLAREPLLLSGKDEVRVVAVHQ